jgi:hypothetical protein
MEGSGSVFFKVRECATAEWQAARQGDTYSAGLDLAKVEDYTVLTIMNQRREVVFMDRFHRLDWTLQIVRIKAALSRYPYCYTLVDSTGVGEPVFEMLKASGLLVKPYPFTAASKTNLVNNLVIAFEQGKITLPKASLAPELVDELESYEYTLTDSGNTRTSAPSGVHDDCVMSLGLALWQCVKGGRGGTISTFATGYPSARGWVSAARCMSLAQRLGVDPSRVGYR